MGSRIILEIVQLNLLSNANLAKHFVIFCDESLSKVKKKKLDGETGEPKKTLLTIICTLSFFSRAIHIVIEVIVLNCLEQYISKI